MRASPVPSTACSSATRNPTTGGIHNGRSGACHNSLADVATAMLAAGVYVEEFEPKQDLASLRACHEVMEAARPIDHPNLPPQSFESFADWWAQGGVPQQSWLARDGYGEPVGCCLLTFPAQENTTMAGCCLVVVPARRRTGLGLELLLGHAKFDER